MVPVIKLRRGPSLGRALVRPDRRRRGTIATGEPSIEQVGDARSSRWFAGRCQAARKQTMGGPLGLHNDFALFNPSPVT